MTINLWASSSKQYNDFIKRFGANLHSGTGIKLNRRDIEEAAAPCLNSGSNHHALSASLKKTCKTTAGFLNTRVSQELVSGLSDLTQTLEQALTYSERNAHFLNCLKKDLSGVHYNESWGDNPPFSVKHTPKLAGITKVLSDWLATPNAELSTQASFKWQKFKGFEKQGIVRINWNDAGLAYEVVAELRSPYDMDCLCCSLKLTIGEELVLMDENARKSDLFDFSFGVFSWWCHNANGLPLEFSMPSPDEISLPVEVLNLIEAQLSTNKS